MRISVLTTNEQEPLPTGPTDPTNGVENIELLEPSSPLNPHEEGFEAPDYGVVTLRITDATNHLFNSNDPYLEALAGGQLLARVRLLNQLRADTAVRTFSVDKDGVSLLCKVQTGDWPKIQEAMEKEIEYDVVRVIGTSDVPQNDSGTNSHKPVTLRIVGATDIPVNGTDPHPLAEVFRQNILLLNRLRRLTADREFSIDEDGTTLLCKVWTSDWSAINRAVRREIKADLERVLGVSSVTIEYHI